MILGDITEFTPAPGRILRWRPTESSSAAAAAAPVDPGAPSILQTDHLAAYRNLLRNGGTHRAWTGVATSVSGALDRDAMTRALHRFLAMHAGLRTWFDVSAPNPVRRLVPPESIEFEIVEDELTVGESGTWHAALSEYLTDRFDTECTPGSWPGFAFGVVEAADEFGVFWGCDHAFTDGASQLMLPSDLADLYAAEVAGADGAGLPAADEVGGFPTYAEEERAAAEEYGPDSPEVSEWVRMVADNGARLPTFPLPLGLEDGEKGQVVVRTMTLLEGDEVDAFDRVCADAGGRATGGVFAAVAAADHALAGRERYFGVTVLSTRDRGPYARSQGWFCAFAPVEFDVASASGFGELVARAQAAFRQARGLAVTPVNVVLETLVTGGVCSPEELGSPQLLSYLDLRRFPRVGTEAERNGVHFPGLGRTANASLWINRDAERLYLLAQVPDNPVAADSVARYHDKLREILRESVAGMRGRSRSGCDRCW
ncbi:hypothetical protein BJF85_06485 [Saccharomonospora sp. CUA-673]|uniref:condensation domain-containing protein n=1 Tax=Saccharomonospora sp. CUA-673 TaxID=1904969 RepID=UPI0009660D98|nr:condensation domain-containing protein [Saccharomonospora sp. CUA-673]OLT39991.1 hypothetical protein BJF85_06485 [Saccharomonospora sp. CUA-673]